MNAQWKYVEDLVQERSEMQAARRHSLEAGVEPISPAVGAQLAQLAAATGAAQIVEIGTGFGVSALWLLTGAPEASLTSIDLEIEYQQAARDALVEASKRVRVRRTRASHRTIRRHRRRCPSTPARQGRRPGKA